MAKKDRAAALRSQFNDARRRGKWPKALEALTALEKLQPDEPRWPHQRGETLRRAGRTEEAIEALERATQLYSDLGFVARSVAVAKVILQLDPERTSVLSQVDPGAARKTYRSLRPHGGGASKQSFLDLAVPLARDESAAPDEVRFIDLPEAESEIVELEMTELEFVGAPAPPPIPAEAVVDEELARVANMPSFPLFAELDPEHLRTLAARSDLVELPDSAIVIEKGEPADALYCIIEGRVRVVVEGVPFEQSPVLGEGSAFGESCLLEGATRHSDVVVAGHLVALCVPKSVLDEVVALDPAFNDLLFELLARRMVSNLLSTSSLFAGFPPSGRRELSRRFELRRAAPGTVLIQRNKRSDGLYVLASGRMELNTTEGRVERGPGTIVGAESLLSRSGAKTGARTLNECVLLRLPAGKFTAFVTAFPPALESLSQLSADSPRLHGESLS